MTLFWIIVIVASVLLEIATATALVSVWFSVGGLVALLLAYLNISLPLQIICFFVVSIGMILVARPLASSYLRGNTVATNADRFIHEVGTITKSVPPNGRGEVKVLGISWIAIEKEGNSIKENSQVRVLAIDGAKLIVTKIKEGV